MSSPAARFLPGRAKKLPETAAVLVRDYGLTYVPPTPRQREKFSKKTGSGAPLGALRGILEGHALEVFMTERITTLSFVLPTGNMPKAMVKIDPSGLITFQHDVSFGQRMMTPQVRDALKPTGFGNLHFAKNEITASVQRGLTAAEVIDMVHNLDKVIGALPADGLAAHGVFGSDGARDASGAQDGAGSLIGGRYRLAEKVGQGGMGRVWRGHDEVLDRDVAVKELLFPSEVPGEVRAEMTQRAKREARSAARLSHPGVVTVHDVVEHRGVPWIVMEYFPGKSLGAMLGDGARLPWQQVAVIGAKLAEALAYVHAEGVVHRDLKPDNVLIHGDRVAITDFGIARLIDENTRLTVPGTLLGTPVYMAPEILDGHTATTAADMWSLGAMLYVAVEGRLPFDGPNLTALMGAILHGQPAVPVHAGPLTDVIIPLLAKVPGQRPAASAIAPAIYAAIVR